MRGLLIVGLLLLSSCAWLNSPATPGQSGTYVWHMPSGESVSLNLPGLPSEPIQHVLPDGSTVTLDPSLAQAPVTMGDKVAEGIGGVAGALTGNGILAFGVAAALKLMFGRSKPKGEPVEIVSDPDSPI